MLFMRFPTKYILYTYSYFLCDTFRGEAIVSLSGPFWQISPISIEVAICIIYIYICLKLSQGRRLYQIEAGSDQVFKQ